MHTPPGSHARRTLLSLILLLPFAVPATALELPEDRWVAQEWDGFGIVASVNGLVTHGDRFFVGPLPKDCDRGYLFFLVYTEANHPEIEALEGKTIPILIDNERLNVRAGYAIKSLLEHAFFMEMGVFPLDRLVRFLAGKERLTIRLVDGDGFRAEDYFHQRRNAWSLDGFREALAEARAMCRAKHGPGREERERSPEAPPPIGGRGDGAVRVLPAAAR
ncbi:MAG TPA: hypothetical protein VGC25_00665 [Alphaproteobacteria bacterium]